MGQLSLDSTALSDASLTDPLYVAAPTLDSPTWVRLEYDRPVRVTGLTLATGTSFGGWQDVLEQARKK